MKIISLLLILSILALAACRTDQQSDEFGPDVSTTGDGGSVSSSTTTTMASHTVVGKVRDKAGSPVPEAVVSMGQDTAVTGPDGFFYLSSTTPGDLIVSKPAWSETVVADPTSVDYVNAVIDPIKVRGLRVGGEAAGDDEKFAQILELADSTAVNSLVFDTKQEGGRVLYDTAVEAAHEAGAVVPAYDPVTRIAEARQHGLYVITRIVTFEDWFRAESHPDQALHGPWIDPTDRRSWEYPHALAVEACELGFDEIQFDYVRFPSGEAVEVSGQLDMTQEQRVAAIEGFLAEARELLHPLGCAVSADVFGIIVSTPNDQGIGQRPEELSRQLDAFSPMVYPSHYDDGWRGFDEPNDHPYDVTADAIDSAARRIEEGTVLRPWLQAFWWTNGQIRRSIQAAEDRGVGWILWNALSNFDIAALPTNAEVSG